MKKVRRTFRRAGLFALCVLFVSASCTRQVKKEESGEAGQKPPMEGAGKTTPSEAEQGQAAAKSAAEDQQRQQEFSEVMYQKRYTQAQAYLKAGQLEQAEQAIQDALGYNPTSKDAQRLRNEIERLRGQRGGEVGTVMEDVQAQQKARLEQQKVNVRRLLDQGKTAEAAGDWEKARHDYEDASFIVTTSKYAPLGGDKDLQALGDQAQAGLKRVEAHESAARQKQEREATQQALKQIASQQAEQLEEARARRARLLSAAIDRFNQEEFAQAEQYANQVLAEEPDNTVARDIVENSRKAEHTAMNESYLKELKNSFRRWQVDIEKAKVPSSDILSWPSQSYWDKISRLRATHAIGGEAQEMTPEEQNVANVLNTRTIDVSFEKLPFPQVRDYLAAASGINFVIDARAKDDLEAADVTLKAHDISVKDALTLIMGQVSPQGDVVYDITGNVVRFIKKENQKKKMVLEIHPVADLTLPLTDFIPPAITQLGVSDNFDQPLFGGQSEEVVQPYGTIDELMELVRSSVGGSTWDEGGQINVQGKHNLIVYNTPAVQKKVTEFLDSLRAFSGIVVTIESRFLSVTDAFLRDVGVDFRGLGGSNGGPLAVLDDVTSGLANNASAGLDNGGPGVNSGGAALAPSSGIFFSDGHEGDTRARAENLFTNPLGTLLSSVGGGTFQVTWLDDVNMSAILRATEKRADIRELTAPSLTVYNTQRANLTVVTQISFIKDFDVEVAQTAFIADPVIGVIQDGLTLDVRPTVSNDRRYITMDLRPTIVNLVTPITTFQTLLGASIAIISAQNPVTIQLPQLEIRKAESTVRIPDGGSLLLGGMKDIKSDDEKSTTPILGNLPILSFLFSRQGKSEEVKHLMIVVTATITDLQEQAKKMRG